MCCWFLSWSYRRLAQWSSSEPDGWRSCGWQNQYLLAKGAVEVMMCSARRIHFFNKAKQDQRCRSQAGHILCSSGKRELSCTRPVWASQSTVGKPRVPGHLLGSPGGRGGSTPELQLPSVCVCTPMCTYTYTHAHAYIYTRTCPCPHSSSLLSIWHIGFLLRVCWTEDFMV